MTFSFHPEAEEEFLAAIRYYESCQRGLGEDFCFEIRSAVQRIVEFPETWPVLEGDVRRCLAHRFPYGLLYSVEEDEIFIVAVMHLRRDPDYWKCRRS
jgi:plasmid stabilization system protein ParE